MRHELDERLAGKVARQATLPRPAARIEPLQPASGEAGIETVWVDIDLIDDNPFQPAGRDADLSDLEEGFDAEGQVKPATARRHPTRPHRFQLADGHRRKYTVKRGANAGIGLPNPQQYIGQLRLEVRKLSDEQMLRYIIESNDNLLKNSPLQQAHVYRQMKEVASDALRELALPLRGEDGKASWQQVAEHFGFSKNKYSDLARVAAILDLPAWVQKEFASDPDNPEKFVLNSRHARALLKFKSAEGTDETTRKLNFKGMDKLLTAIKRERISGSEADKRAEKIKDELFPTVEESGKESAGEDSGDKGSSSKSLSSKNSKEQGSTAGSTAPWAIGDPVYWTGQDGKEKSGVIEKLLPGGKVEIRTAGKRDPITHIRESKLRRHSLHNGNSITTHVTAVAGASVSTSDDATSDDATSDDATSDDTAEAIDETTNEKSNFEEQLDNLDRHDKLGLAHHNITLAIQQIDNAEIEDLAYTRYILDFLLRDMKQLKSSIAEVEATLSALEKKAAPLHSTVKSNNEIGR